MCAHRLRTRRWGSCRVTLRLENDTDLSVWVWGLSAWVWGLSAREGSCRVQAAQVRPFPLLCNPAPKVVQLFRVANRLPVAHDVAGASNKRISPGFKRTSQLRVFDLHTTAPSSTVTATARSRVISKTNSVPSTPATIFSLSASKKPSTLARIRPNSTKSELGRTRVFESRMTPLPFGKRIIATGSRPVSMISPVGAGKAGLREAGDRREDSGLSGEFRVTQAHVTGIVAGILFHDPH